MVFETIKVEHGKAENLTFHNQRVARTSKTLFNQTPTFNLEELINPPSASLYRCRVTYAKELEKVEYLPYELTLPKKLKIIEANIDYTYKYTNRDALNALVQEGYDDVIISKNGLLTDTTIANLALFRDGVWFTPKKPLLEGTMRATLLSEDKLTLKDIPSDTLKEYSKVALINAMVGFLELETIIIE